MDMDKAALYDLVKGYLEGALKVEMKSEFGRGYVQGLRTLQGYLETLEGSPVLLERTQWYEQAKPKKIA